MVNFSKILNPKNRKSSLIFTRDTEKLLNMFHRHCSHIIRLCFIYTSSQREVRKFQGPQTISSVTFLSKTFGEYQIQTTVLQLYFRTSLSHYKVAKSLPHERLRKKILRQGGNLLSPASTTRLLVRSENHAR